MSSLDIIAHRYSQRYVDTIINTAESKIQTLRFQLFRLQYKYNKLNKSKDNAIDIIHFTHNKAKEWQQKALDSQKIIDEHTEAFHALLESHAKALYELDFLRDNYKKLTNHTLPVSLKLRLFFKKLKCKFTRTPFINWQDRKEPIYWNNRIEYLEQIIKERNTEIDILREAVEFFLVDWTEDLVRQGKSYDEIVKERARFEKIMYWKRDGSLQLDLINL